MAGGRYMNDDEDDPQPILAQRFILSDLVAAFLCMIRNMFGVVANGLDSAADIAKAHSNAVADEREFVTEARSDIARITGRIEGT